MSNDQQVKPGLETQHRGPGRPRRFDYDNVINLALELFWKQGFANTTTRDLEYHLSLNQSSIYNSFGSKEQLFEKVLDRYQDASTQALLKPMEDTDDSLQALQEFFRSLKNWVTSDGRRGCLLINMMAEDGGENGAMSARTTAYRLHVKQVLKKAIIKAIDQGKMMSGDAEVRATILLGLALGINITARGGAPEEELNTLLYAVSSQIQSWSVLEI